VHVWRHTCRLLGVSIKFNLVTCLAVRVIIFGRNGGDIATPEVSDTEVDNEDIEETDLACVRDSLMQVDSFPRRYTEYSELYQREEYRLKAKLKVRYAKKLLKSVRLEPLMAGPNLVENLNRVESTYPDDGGREGINLLVAIHNTINEY